MGGRPPRLCVPRSQVSGQAAHVQRNELWVNGARWAGSGLLERESEVAFKRTGVSSVWKIRSGPFHPKEASDVGRVAVSGEPRLAAEVQKEKGLPEATQ